MQQLLEFVINATPLLLNLFYGGFVIRLLGSLGLAYFEIESRVVESQEKPFQRMAIIHQVIIFGFATPTIGPFLWYRPDGFPPELCAIIIAVTLIVLWPFARVDDLIARYFDVQEYRSDPTNYVP